MVGEHALLSVPRRAIGTPSAVVFAPSGPLEARFRDALKGRARIRMVRSFDAVTAALRESTEPVDLVVLPSHNNVIEATRIIHIVTKERPTCAVVAYCRVGSEFSPDIRTLAKAGVHQFVFLGVDDTGVALREVLSRARRQCAATLVLERWLRIVPSTLHPLLEVAVSRPDYRTVPSLALALGVHRKTLFNRCQRAKCVAPEELVMWARLSLVASLLQTTGCTLETISIDLSFTSATSLRNTMKRYTGMTATEVKLGRGLDAVIAAYEERLRRLATVVDSR